MEKIEQYRDINVALSDLARSCYELEDEYVQNDGEVTEETERKEARIQALRILLHDQGIDLLGRWLKGKEDELKTAKAEKAAADRRVKSIGNTIDFIKAKITEVMKATGMEKAKGTYYGFTATVSERSSVNQEEVDRLYYAIAESAARAAGVPDWIEVNLKTTATAVKEAGATELLDTTVTDTVRFTKPRAAKD